MDEHDARAEYAPELTTEGQEWWQVNCPTCGSLGVLASVEGAQITADFHCGGLAAD